MKKLVLVIGLLAIVGCSESTPEEIADKEAETKVYYQRIEQSYRDSINKNESLKGCTISIVTGRWSDIIMARCPNSTTSATYKVGKSQQTTVTTEQ